MSESAEGSRSRGLWSKLRQGLSRTHTRLVEQLGGALEGRGELDETSRGRLEEALIAADLGVDTAQLVLERLASRARRSDVGSVGRLRELLAEEIATLLAEVAPPPDLARRPAVVLVVGVNGAGKTTSIAKLAARARRAGEKVVLAAADTFRAAAIEQLALWGERIGVDVVRQSAGADPAAVVFDGIAAARARRADQLIVDTAGRLHTKDHLMAELQKIRRVVDREAADWARQTILVLDATTGQNALGQARSFLGAAHVDGVLLAKLDGTAKGGMVVAIGRELRLPVLYMGVGEKADDLVDFDAREFAAALLE